MYNTQQPTKKIDIQKCYRTLLAPELPNHLVSNTFAKLILKAPESKEDIFESPRGQSGSGVQATNQAEKTQTGTRKTTQKTRPKSKSGLTSSEKKTLDKQYLKGPALFGNSAQLKTQSNLSFDNNKSCLEKEPSFTKYRSIHLRFTRLKVIVKDIVESRSVDMAYEDKLAKEEKC